MATHRLATYHSPRHKTDPVHLLLINHNRTHIATRKTTIQMYLIGFKGITVITLSLAHYHHCHHGTGKKMI